MSMTQLPSEIAAVFYRQYCKAWWIFSLTSLIVLVCGVWQLNVDGGRVCLWVGADTFIEFSYDEGIDLIQSQHTQTLAKLDELSEDLFHLRGNSITVEVNMARLFNHSVKLKKQREAAAAGEGSLVTATAGGAATTATST
jgi:Prefoldin subunit